MTRWHGRKVGHSALQALNCGFVETGYPVPAPQREFLLKDLLHAVYWFDESLQNHLEASGWPRLSRTKSMIMINIADGVTRPIQIAANLGISRQAVHLALAELEREGLVLMEADPDDRRAKRVRYSEDPRGIKMRDDALRTLHQVEAQLEKRVGRGAYRQLCKALRVDWGHPLTPDSSWARS